MKMSGAVGASLLASLANEHEPGKTPHLKGESPPPEFVPSIYQPTVVKCRAIT